jgi:hypothetical protein
VNPVAGLGVAILVSVGAILTWWAGGRPGTLREWSTPARVVVGGYLILYGLGAVGLAASGEAARGPLLVGGAFVAMGIGVWLVRALAGPAAPMVAGTTVGPIRIGIVLALVAIGLAMYAWLAVDYGIPLLSGDAQHVRLGWGGIRLDLFRWLVPPAALLLVGVAIASRDRNLSIAAGAALAGVVVLEVAAASRALPLELGLAAVLVAVWAGRHVSRRGWFLVVAAAALVFFGVLFARVAPEGGFTGPLDTAAFAVNRTVGRVALIHPRTIEVVVDVFPTEEPYLAGGSYVRWLAYVRGTEPPPPLGSELFERLFPTEPPGGFAAPGLLAEAYANFGPVWALLLMVAVGAFAAWIGRWLSRASPSAATRAFAALIVVATLRTYATSLNGFVLTAGAALGWWILVEPVDIGRQVSGVRARLRREAPPGAG